MVDFRTKDGKPLDRAALKKSGRFPSDVVAATSSTGYKVTRTALRPTLRPAVRSGATISADTADRLVKAIGHSQAAIDVCKSLIDGPPESPGPKPEQEKLRRQWSHAIRLTG